MASKPCLKCYNTMHGIEDYTAREVCEPCGGNITDYNKYNPHPESFSAKQPTTE